MFQKQVDFAERVWPLGLVALAFGLVYCLLLCVFEEAIEASEKMRDYLANYEWGGAEALFALNSGLLGWVSIVVAEYRFGISGWWLFLITLPCGFAAIGGGFVLALLLAERLPSSAWEIILLCLVFMIGTGAFRVYLDDGV
jgi:hypothetical protein